MTETVKPIDPIPAGHRTVTPYLVVPEADALIGFMERAFGAVVHDKSYDGEGRLMHADLQIGDSRVMLGQSNDTHPPLRSMLHLYVPDADAVYDKAIAAGAKSLRAPETMFYGDRSGGVEDASGTQWWISTHVEDVSPEEMERRMAAQGG